MTYETNQNMKLNNENYDQSSFTHTRVMLCLFWLRSKRFVPGSLRVSYRDILFVYLEHNCSEKISSMKSIYVRIVSKLRKGRG